MTKRGQKFAKLSITLINNTAADCQILLTFTTNYDHVTPDLPQSFKVKGDVFARCFRFVTVHAFDGQTDRRTDGFTIANTPLHPMHTMQRGKNRL